MIEILFIFSQLYISTGAHIKTSSSLLLRKNLSGVGGNIFFKFKDTNLMPDLSFTYLWNLNKKYDKIKGWEIGVTFWNAGSKNSDRVFYPGGTISFLNYKYYDYDYYEKESLLIIGFSGLINIKVHKYALGLKGSIGSILPYFLFLLPLHYEIAVEFYRIPE